MNDRRIKVEGSQDQPALKERRRSIRRSRGAQNKQEPVNPASAAQADEVWKLVGSWHERAAKLGAVERNDSLECFILSGADGAIRVNIEQDEPGHERFWGSLMSNTLTSLPDFVWIGPGLLEVGKYEARLQLDADAAQAFIAMLQPGAVEVAPQVQVPYGFVNDGKVVAVSFTTEVYKKSRTDRADLGLNEDTFVADRDAFQRLSPPQDNLANWYTQFWALQQAGSVVNLSARAKALPEETWFCAKGADCWIEFDDSDGASPEFLVGVPYVSWKVATNQPALTVRGGKRSHKNPLREWWQ